MAAILKNSETRTTGRPALADVNELAAETRRFCEEARREAAELLARARAETVQIRQQAAEEGRQAARLEAEAALRSALQQQLAEAPRTWSEVLLALQRTRQEWLARWERDAVELARAIAARIVRREVARDSEIALPLVRETLELTAGRTRAQLALHPRDIDLLAEQLRRLVADLGKTAVVEVVADERIEPGSCRLTSELGMIDQQWSAQLARIAEELD